MITETRNTIFGLKHSVATEVRRAFNGAAGREFGFERDPDDLLAFVDEFEREALEIAEAFVPMLNSNILWTAADAPNLVCYPESPDPEGDPISTIRQGISEVLDEEAIRECNAIRSRIMDGELT